MEHVGFFETAQEYPDGRHAAEHGGTGFGFSLFLERALVSDIREDRSAGSTVFPPASENVLGPSGKIVAKSDDLAVECRHPL
jgi:hypothetical protein